MQKVVVPYSDRETHLEGFAAYPSKEKRPAVILCHAWRGRDDFICEKAEAIASWGYVGFALDMYGKGVLGNSKEENAALKKPFFDNRELLQARVLKAFEVTKSLAFVDSNQIAVLGFGFGGTCALDLACSGVDLRGAISIYGHLSPPPASLIRPIQAKVLVFHGYNDPIVPQEELLAFENEMNRARVDWQAQIYGGTMHAFATPSANDPISGILYNPISAKRAWLGCHHFLDEVFRF
jgi:dienelactone hydrolase